MVSIREFFAGRRLLFGLWLLSCAAALALTLRLTVFMVAPAQVAFSVLPDNEFLRRHSCFSAYVAAADLLGEPGASIYDPSHYVRNAPDASRRIPLYGFEQDKYEYTPVFLLLPRALLAISKDFRVLRALWFALSSASVLGAMALAARWIGGRRGLAAALLMPLVWGTLVNLSTLQVGNVQFLVVAASVVAMIAFESRRPALGGAVLAFAIASKLYPCLLLADAIARRRYRDLLWTAGFGLLYCGAVVAIAGPGPFVDFLTVQMPRLASGEAFAFFKDRPEDVATNLSFYGLPYKLRLLGLLETPDRIAPLVSRGFAVLLLALVAYFAWDASRQGPPESSDERAALATRWLAILALASLQSAFAPPYVVLAVTWLLAIWAPAAEDFKKSAARFALGWVCLTVLIPRPFGLLLATASVAQAAAVGISLAALFASRGRPRVTQPAPEAGR